MKYKDLNLKKIREDNDLDFAHFTYQRGMCSCCYGPWDLPKRYWRGGKIKAENDNVQYILFKNAENGDGVVTRNDEIEDYTCVEWEFPIEKLENVCRDLQNQLGSTYVVLQPTTTERCILICKANSIYIREELRTIYYTTIQND